MLLSLSHPYRNFSSQTSSTSSTSSFLPFPQRPPPLLSPFFRTATPVRASISDRAPQRADETLAKSAIHRIAEKLRSLGFIEDSSPSEKPPTGPGSAGEIFIPTPKDVPNYRVGHTIDSSWSTPAHPVPEPGSAICRQHDYWKEKMRTRPWSPENAPSVAELTLPPAELKRLRAEGIRLEKRLKVGKAGITEGIVNGIHERWRRFELVKIRCEDLCRMNMKRTHEILERKTGGLVVWRSGSVIILYRGANYKYPYFSDDNSWKGNPNISYTDSSTSEEIHTEQEEALLANKFVKSPSISARSASVVIGVGSPKKLRLQLPGEIQMEEEADRLLDGLGPRFTDWWGSNPLPVDADLLPSIVPGFRKPFRLLPFGVQPKLTDREMTILRRLSHPLPCHFALGRNRNHQGLAISMIKLWEKCEIAKIAVKRGVQNTSSEIMAEELKKLTGGTLLSRDGQFIVFYRGKDFLPPAVSSAIEERRSEIIKLKQNTNENLKTPLSYEPGLRRSASVYELQEATEPEQPTAKRETLNPVTSALERVNAKLSQTLLKKEKAEQLLAELEKSVELPLVEPDREAISEEERYMLRKVGLRMGPYLLLGRRGVFDGTIENMHLHWKYRELVKILSNGRSMEEIETTARILEAESGGILVGIDRVRKGYAIIVYRGKNYQRPAMLRPQTLLSKREALKCYKEAQRRESLKLHVLSLSRNIDQLQQKLVNGDPMIGSEQLTEFGRTNSMTETNDLSESYEKSPGVSERFASDQENTEKVEEVCEEYVEIAHCNVQDQVLSVAGESDKPSNKSKVSKFDKLTEDGVLQSVSKSSCIMAVSNDEMRSTSEKVAFHTEIVDAYVEDSSTSTTNTQGATHLLDKEPRNASLGNSLKTIPDASIYEDGTNMDSNVQIPFKAAPLSNRERLMLRKQALKMRKRPVLAVGRNNIITGVAKTIMTHFKKHPLAIVNIKGRAKGTSVQEIIFELEQATGAVLVSREPNKVILYRGWGDGELGGVKEPDARKKSTAANGAVSPQLMEAIKLECGLQTD
ncbi:Poly(A)-specific exoribonuclease PARN protein [Dioscorea alata]|uniref:Poly(A)-specific exoribonuclease PARN protein n=1 Tax=Dioscorea alata TaxID=55571 RepID=A0ACB7WKJ9_DIOAL|nr:Poly(A)-specific exoribonuclease PARN protein [Dioscorea alata]